MYGKSKLYFSNISWVGAESAPVPTWKYIADDYILADTQAFLSKRHRQQNKKILIRHITGISESFFVFKYSINWKSKKVFLRGCKNTFQRFVLMKGYFFAGKIKNFYQEPVFMPFIFYICVRTFFSRHKNDFYNS